MKSPFKDKPNIRRYSIIPARAMQDDRLNKSEMKVLACLGMYANSYGVCWPSQAKIAHHVGTNHNWVCRTMTRLIQTGYVRKLEFRAYPRGYKARSHRPVNRYQVLWEGNEPLPSKEQFWAPKPKFSDVEDDGYVTPDDTLKQTGESEGKGIKESQRLASAFKQAVEAASGMVRQAEPSFKEAKLLWDQGVTVEQVRQAATEMTKDALRSGRTPPANLRQVSKWAGLVKN